MPELINILHNAATVEQYAELRGKAIESTSMIGKPYLSFSSPFFFSHARANMIFIRNDNSVECGQGQIFATCDQSPPAVQPNPGFVAIFSFHFAFFAHVGMPTN
jgi:hypothetical protein